MHLYEWEEDHNKFMHKHVNVKQIILMDKYKCIINKILILMD